MGIRGLDSFVKNNPNLFKEFQLHNCGVVLDGNSIYHQMYRQNRDLICGFGGEYYQYYRYCTQLFESFRVCNINVLVVFDGAQLDDRKLLTSLNRAQQRVDKSLSNDPNVDLSPILLRQTFISVLDTMKIPYVSALGEGDDECVSLANHLDCYLIADDSDYFCYDLHRGYIPFEYVDINPIKKHSSHYLIAGLYHIDLLMNEFNGLQPSTLALACCLCGNDYISRERTRPVLNRIVTEATLPLHVARNRNIQLKYLYAAMQWMRQFSSIDSAFEKLITLIDPESEQIKVESELRIAVQSYLNPSDTLIYRFISLNNQNLLFNPNFNQRAQAYLNTLNMTEDELRAVIDNNSRSIRSKNDHSLPLFLADAVSDRRLSSSFIEVLIHRRLICKAHIEVNDQPSIYEHAIRILFPCLAILLRWDQEPKDLSIDIYYRVNNKLEKHMDPLIKHEDALPELDEIQSMSLGERQNFVRKYLMMPNEVPQQWNHIHFDCHFWLMIIRYWYIKHELKPVYLYAVIICLVEVVFLRIDAEDHLAKEQMNVLSTAFGNDKKRQHINPTTRQQIFKPLKQMRGKVLKKKSFDNSIIYKLNCLQTICLYSSKVNEFFQKPFPYPVHPQYFICGSLFYAFVDQYQNDSNLDGAMRGLLRNQTVLLNYVHDLYTCISTVSQNED